MGAEPRHEETGVRPAVRTGGIAALLAVVLAGAWATGAALHPPFPGTGTGLPTHAPATTGRPADNLTLVPHTTELDPGRPGEYVFALTGADRLATPPRLTVVRRDATGLQHLTAETGPDGTWRAALTLPAAGAYQMVIDVTPTDGAPRTLRADLLAPGPFAPEPFTPSRVAEVDGYQVRLDGDLVPDAPAQVFATVSRAGAPVTDLEPVDGDLGRAFGRLEALRAGDLAPVRVHPDAAAPAPDDRAGPGIAFTAEAPGAGTYRLFLDFRHGGVPHTAVFTVVTGSTG